MPRPLPDGPLGLSFDDVRFGYTRSAAGAARAAAGACRPGETLAMVGGAGSGKSTLAMLMPRFYDVHAGAVRVGGVDVRQLRLADLRSQIGMVFEDSFLFSDTVAANIAYGRPAASQRTDRGGGPGGRGRRVHPRAAGRLRHPGRRARADPVRRPAAADRAGPGAAHRSADHAARRRHQRGRPPDRGGDPGHPAAADPGPHHAADRAPPFHPGAGRPDRGAGRRPGGRHRHASRS